MDHRKFPCNGYFPPCNAPRCWTCFPLPIPLFKKTCSSRRAMICRFYRPVEMALRCLRAFVSLQMWELSFPTSLFRFAAFSLSRATIMRQPFPLELESFVAVQAVVTPNGQNHCPQPQRPVPGRGDCALNGRLYRSWRNYGAWRALFWRRRNTQM